MPRIRTLHLVAPLLVVLGGCAHGPSPKEQKTAEIHNDLAVEALRGGRSQEALKQYNTALAADPDMPEALMGRALVMEYGFGKLAEAESDYRHALLVRPNYPEAHNNLGQLLARTGRSAEALAEFDKAIDINLYMEPWVARCNKGQTLYQMGRKDEGLTELRTCIRIAPRYCQGRRELGRILLTEGKATEAVSELEGYAHACPKVADAQLQLGLAKLKAGDAAGARSAFERCEALAGEAPEAEECRKTLQLLK
jgi:type IV pilus biogenesis/stability protein PilW